MILFEIRYFSLLWYLVLFLLGFVLNCCFIQYLFIVIYIFLLLIVTFFSLLIGCLFICFFNAFFLSFLFFFLRFSLYSYSIFLFSVLFMYITLQISFWLLWAILKQALPSIHRFINPLTHPPNHDHTFLHEKWAYAKLLYIFVPILCKLQDRWGLFFN